MTPQTALLAISVVSGWVYAGFYMIIFYAAFRQMPAEVLEAARLDGAGEWALFRRVKVPMIRSAIAVAVLLCVTGGFQGFDLFFVLTNGGPYGATEIPTTLLVKTVFRNGDVGYGSAMAVHADRDRRRRRARVRAAPGPRAAGGRGATAAAPMAMTVRGVRCGGRGRPNGRRRLPVSSSAAHGRALGVVFFFPMVWMVLSSFKTEPGHLPSPVRAARVHRPRALGRGVGGRQPRPVRGQQRDRDRASR